MATRVPCAPLRAPLRTLRPARRMPHAARRTACQAAGPKSGAPAAAAPLGSDASIAALLSWARDRGVRAPLLTPASFGGLRGMAAASDVAAGAAAASVPHSAVIETTSLSSSCPHAGVCPPKAWAALPWWGRLALLLLREDRLGAASAFAPYLAALPRRFDTTLHWSDAQLARLRSPRLAARVAAQRAELAAAHAAMSREAAAAEPACLAARDISLDSFTWATEAVRSRTFAGPYEGSDAADRKLLAAFIAVLVAVFLLTGAGPPENAASGALSALFFIVIKDLLVQQLPNAPRRYVLCPVVDLCNHSGDAVSDLAYEYFQDSFSLLTGDFKRGEQVLISYGPQGNDELLQYYGFVEADNPHDTVPLCDAAEDIDAGVDALIALTGASAERVAAVRAGGGVAALAALEVTRAGELRPAGAAAALRALCAPDAEFASAGAAGCASAAAAEAAAAVAAAALQAAHPPGAAAELRAEAAKLAERAKGMPTREAAAELALQYRAAKAAAAAKALPVLQKGGYKAPAPVPGRG